MGNLIKILKISRIALVVLMSVFLVTISIDAVDNYNNISDSIIGNILGMEKKGPCPRDMVYVADGEMKFCMDRYEASPSSNCLFSAPGSHNETTLNLSDAECRAESEAGREPWIYLSKVQARILCLRSGKRLATPEEWFAASLGTPDKESGFTGDDCQLDKNWEDQPGPTGSGRDCVSATGVYDMGGNVWEWVSGEVREGKYNNVDLPSSGYVDSVDFSGIPVDTGKESNPDYHNDFLWIKKDGIRIIARGGYWESGEKGGKFSSYVVAPAGFAGQGIGFRCAKDTDQDH